VDHRALRIAVRAKSDDWHVDHQLTHGGTEKLAGCVSKHQIEDADNFRRIKLPACFEDGPVYPAGRPRRVAGVCTQQNAV